MYEIASLLGNVMVVDNTPFVHEHIVLGSKAGRVYAGHLYEATVTATCEVIIRHITNHSASRHG